MTDQKRTKMNKLVEFARSHPEGFTRKQAQEFMGYKTVSSVIAYLNELIAWGYLSADRAVSETGSWIEWRYWPTDKD